MKKVLIKFSDGNFMIAWTSEAKESFIIPHPFIGIPVVVWLSGAYKNQCLLYKE